MNELEECNLAEYIKHFKTVVNIFYKEIFPTNDNFLWQTFNEDNGFNGLSINF